jgi:DNA-binding response OmpR family regulator
MGEKRNHYQSDQSCSDAFKSRILIVDDEEYVRNFLKDALEVHPYSIKLAVDANDAMEILKENEFELILSDINLPGMSGLELLSFCKTTYKTTEVILITGDPELDGAVESIKHGAFDYLSKPILPAKLYERVAAALKHGMNKLSILASTSTEFFSRNYSVIKTLGSGNTGIVFLVEKDKQHYAMKILRRDMDDPIHNTKMQRFIREADILSQLEHPNIAKIVDFGISDKNKTPYIVMEFISGTPLNQLIGKTQFLLSEKIAIIKQTANALKTVHELGILHRDIKPANIIITEDNIVKLMDFGIASLKDSDLTMTSELLGSPAYMSPEAFDGLKIKDKRSDIFSLGVIAYELFTGIKPFQGDSIGELINVIKVENPIEPIKIDPSIPEYIQDILAKMLTKDPEDRFSDTEKIIDALNQKDTNIKKPGISRKFLQTLLLKKSTWS